MMLNQEQPAPLTEENLKKHQRQTSRKQTPLKKFIARQTSLRSAGDGESVEWVCDEQILKVSDSLEDQKSDEKQRSCDQPEKSPSDSTASVVLQDMNKQKDKDSPESSAEKNNRPSSNEAHDKDQSSKDEDDKELSHEERCEPVYDVNSDNADDSVKDNDNDEDSEDESDSSSSLDSESDVLTKVSKSDQRDEDSNPDSADSSRSSSPLIEDDDDDDDDVDDEDDSTEEEEEMEEDAKSESELTHYSSSLNASVSSIPTICDDIESPESSNSLDELDEQNKDENVEDEQGNEVELPEQEQERNNEHGEEEEKMSEDAEDKLGEMSANHENLSDHEDDNCTPPSSRQVSGRSATSLTVVLSEFDDVESTIFDRREQSPLCSSGRDKLTPSENSDCSEVSIKNWAGFGRSCVSSKVDSTQRLSDKQVNHHENKRFKTRKERNVTKPNLIKKNVSKAKRLKEQPASKTASKKTDRKGKFIRQISLSSDNSDTINNQQKRVARPKKRLTKRVSFDNSKIENSTKRTTSDSAFFGSRTGSRDDEDQASPRPPESEHSSRASNRWSAVESEHGSSTGTRPVSTVQSPRSFFSSRQTTFVDKVTAANRAPVIHGKKAKVPSLKNRGK